MTQPFDFRNTQHSGELIPRDGELYSRPWVNLEGDFPLICPTPDIDLPTVITARARLSWWPAHATFAWLDGGGFQKLPARPPEENEANGSPRNTMTQCLAKASVLVFSTGIRRADTVSAATSGYSGAGSAR